MICVLGDAHLDVVARVSWPLAEETDTPAATQVGVGGQAANVAAWVAAVGGHSRLIAARGTDLAAQLVSAELARLGVQLVGPEVPGRTGVVVSLSDGGQKRSMITDRGVGTELAAGSVRQEWLDGCDWLHISGYSLARDPVRGAALAAAAAAAERSAKLSVDLSSTAMIEAYGVGSFRALISRLQPDVVFGNAAEAALLGNLPADRLVVKLGPAGVRVAGLHYPALPTVPVDSTGAGDAFAAGYLVGGVGLGLRAAARAAAKMGGNAMTFAPQLSAEVAEALGLGRPVVALETTLVSHGFSGGRGLAVALESEQRVRDEGAVPATIGVLDGMIRVGLDAAELSRFADAGLTARKVGARDLAACAVQGALGSTTVGGSLAVCGVTGIRFLGTGGIGGVHRGFAASLDMSADLPQLARTPAMVVCSGAKSILDVPATAELLETLGVPVLGWRTGTLPMFYSAEGGPPVSATVAETTEAARIAAAHWQLSPASGLILARPPADGLDIEAVVTAAVEQVRSAGVTGQAVTPAILAAVEELSGGRSVEVNRRLIADNAALAGQVAVAYAAVARS